MTGSSSSNRRCAALAHRDHTLSVKSKVPHTFQSFQEARIFRFTERLPAQRTARTPIWFRGCPVSSTVKQPEQRAEHDADDDAGDQRKINMAPPRWNRSRIELENTTFWQPNDAQAHCSPIAPKRSGWRVRSMSTSVSVFRSSISLRSAIDHRRSRPNSVTSMCSCSEARPPPACSRSAPE